MNEQYEAQLRVLTSPSRVTTTMFGTTMLYDPNLEDGPFGLLVSEREALQVIRSLQAFPPLPTDSAAHPLELKVLEQADQIIAELTAHKLRGEP